MSKLGTNPTPKMNFYPEYVPATRPAAPVEGLETVGYVTTSPTGAEVFQRKPLVPGHGQFGYKQDAVVTRSQAEELLAAERAETMRQVKHWSELYKQQHYRAEKAEAIIAAKDERLKDCRSVINEFKREIKKHEADNAALTARIEASEKEVDRLQMARAFDGWLYHNPDTGTEWAEQHPIVSGEVPDATQVRAATATAFQNELIPAWEDLAEETNRRKALETQLAVARKALQEIAGDTYDDSAEKVARAALEDRP